jgi:WD repeat-containing protein 23
MHTLDALVSIASKLDPKQQDDVSLFLMECKYFVQLKGSTNPEVTQLRDILDFLQDRVLTKKQVQSVFQSTESDILSTHFKDQRRDQTYRQDFTKSIHPKEEITMDPEMTPITPSSPRFFVFYDFVYIPELVSLIFQYLDTPSQLEMREVCNLWKTIAEDELLWKFKFLDSFTIHDGDSNYKKDTSIIKNNRDDESRSWRELCMTCTKHEIRHVKSTQPIQINSGGDFTIDHDSNNRLYSCRISRDGQFVVAGGQSTSVQILKIKNILTDKRESFIPENRPTRLTLEELFTGRRSIPRETKPTRRDRIKVHATVDTTDVGWTISDLDFSYDSKLMTYSTWNPYIPVISIEDPSKRIEIPLTEEDEGRYCAFSVRFSPNNKELLTGCSDGTLYCCDYIAGKVSACVTSSPEDLNAVAYGGDNYPDILFTGGDDCVCKIWDKRDLKKPIGVLIGHRYGIASVSSKGDGIHYLSSSKDQTIKLWDIRKLSGTDSGILKLKSVQDSMNPMNWDYRYPEMIPQEHLQVKNPYDKSIMTYTGSHQLFKTLIRCDFSPEFSTAQKYIVTGSVDGNIVLYETATGKVAHKVRASGGLIREVSWHPYMPLLVTAGWNGKVSSVTYTGKLGDIKFVQK